MNSTAAPVAVAGPRTSAPYVISILACGAVLTLMQLYMVIPLSGRMQDHYGIGGQAVAWVGAAFGLAFALGNLVFGLYADGRDRRKIMAIGLIGVAVCASIVGTAPNVGILLAARFAGGFFTAAFAPVALAYLGRSLTPRLRPIGLATVSGCFLLAGIIGQGYGLLGLDHLSQTVLFALTVPPLVAVALLVLRLPRGTGTTGSPSPIGMLRASRELLGRTQIRAAYFAAVTLLLSFVAMYSGLNVLARDEYGIDGLGSLFLVRLVGIPGIVVGILSGPLLRRWGPGSTGTVALSIASAGLLLEALAGSQWALVLSSALFMFGLGVAVPSMVAVVSQAAGSAPGVAMAGYGFMIGLGASLAPLLVAAMASSTFTALCVVLAVILAVAAIAIALSTRGKEGGLDE